jgi:hypothetical protein
MSEQVAMSKMNADMAQGQVYVHLCFTFYLTGLSRGVLVKLIIFSVTLGVLPIGSYFLSLEYVWKGTYRRYLATQMLTACIGNSTFAAITAIVAANLVLVAYIITAVREDRTNATSGSQTVEKETKKDR